MPTYGFCKNKCKKEVVTREDFENEYFNRSKIIFSEVSNAFQWGQTTGDVVISLSDIYLENNINITEVPEVILTNKTAQVCLTLKAVEALQVTVHFDSIVTDVSVGAPLIDKLDFQMTLVFDQS